MEKTIHRIPGIPLSKAGGLPPIRAALSAAAPLVKNAAPPVRYEKISAALGPVLRPQAASRWMLPALAAMTPQYVENILRGALGGGHVQAWELFDLMCDTDPEIASCVGEYCDGILKKRIIFEPYHRFETGKNVSE